MELKKEVTKELSEIVKQKRTDEIANNKHITYGLHRNTMFLYIRQKTINKWLNHK